MARIPMAPAAAKPITTTPGARVGAAKPDVTCGATLWVVTTGILGASVVGMPYGSVVEAPPLPKKSVLVGSSLEAESVGSSMDSSLAEVESADSSVGEVVSKSSVLVGSVVGGGSTEPPPIHLPFVQTEPSGQQPLPHIGSLGPHGMSHLLKGLHFVPVGQHPLESAQGEKPASQTLLPPSLLPSSLLPLSEIHASVVHLLPGGQQ